MKVAFRADASVHIGTGHVMRCLTLADELTYQGHECLFVCREHQGHLGDLITSKGYGLTLLPSHSANGPESRDASSDNYALWLGVPWQEDARQTFDVLTQWKPEWLVVDHYALDAKWERALANAVGSIMVIDDLANRPHQCALLLDQNLGRKVSDYDELLPVDCQRLIGPRYALLRPEFAELRERSLARRQKPEIKRILISLGGVDRTNVTGRVLDALVESTLPHDIELDIVMGAAAPFLNDVRLQAAELPFRAIVSVNVEDMAARMYLADLSIGAVGSTSWERCCMGLPAILMVLAENQKSAAEALKRSGAVIITDSGLGIRAELETLLSPSACEYTLNRMVQLGSGMVQGDGCVRVTNELIARSCEL